MEVNLIKHPEFGAIRTDIIGNDVWFCGKDVCMALGYVNHRKALLDHCKEKGVTKRNTPTDGGHQLMKFINEGNMYRLILNSHLPAAERFENWVCDEVLPQIRRNGFYGVRTKKLRGGDEHIDVMRMLSLIDSFLLHGDKKYVAKLIGVSQVAINKVLRGHNRSPRILSALYDCAMVNSRNVNGNLYLSPEKAIERLLNPKSKF